MYSVEFVPQHTYKDLKPLEQTINKKKLHQKNLPFWINIWTLQLKPGIFTIDNLCICPWLTTWLCEPRWRMIAIVIQLKFVHLKLHKFLFWLVKKINQPVATTKIKTHKVSFLRIGHAAGLIPLIEIFCYFSTLDGSWCVMQPLLS